MQPLRSARCARRCPLASRLGARHHTRWGPHEPTSAARRRLPHRGPCRGPDSTTPHRLRRDDTNNQLLYNWRLPTRVGLSPSNQARPGKGVHPARCPTHESDRHAGGCGVYESYFGGEDTCTVTLTLLRKCRAAVRGGCAGTTPRWSPARSQLLLYFDRFLIILGP